MRLNLLPSKYLQSPFTISTPKGRELAKQVKPFQVSGLQDWKFFTNALPGAQGETLFVATEAVSGCALHPEGVGFLTRGEAESHARDMLASMPRWVFTARVSMAIGSGRVVGAGGSQ